VRDNDRDEDDKKMSSDLENGDEDYIEDTEEIDPTVFHIWDPLQKPVTLQYTTEQLHSERVAAAACTVMPTNVCSHDTRR